MAGFKCDICGGDIRMQANKTGVCQGCGMEYDLEAIKAMAGQISEPAAPAPSAPAAPVPAPKSTDEIERPVLVSYLNELRVMETVIHNDNLAISKAQKTVCDFQQRRDNAVRKRQDNINITNQNSKTREDNIKVMKQQSGKNKTDFIQLMGGVGAIAGIAFFVFVLLDYWIIALIIPVLYVALFIAGLVYEEKALKTRTNEYLEKSQQSKEANDKLIKDQAVVIDNLNSELSKKKGKAQKAIDECNAEKKAVGALLAKAYSANIIPQQFRNIQGVYYLYDYLSTSNQSLSEALMQANLESIKQKMDKMIQLQSVQIIQQAQTNAKLGQLIEISEDIRMNTALAAKYAEIAAINSALNAQLAAESLAYQRVDFWLK
ncbi:hypothetical protein SAMN02910353_01667 [Ruminococcus sp. YRD2003]|uniref:hypothetical protein n=1 Tax=Ruminococcus sp. YRD2003 TaxID=1452313 RepID=UPI0008BBD72F|nr:hypothetical protein SAMN02910353_01667 [Ruminococcus flavefaciens]